jgi:acyl-ACP thioesterase
MAESEHIFQTQFTIRSYEVGANQKTTIATIADLFQEAAGLHAKKLNFDITDLHDLGLTWVLYKMHIRVFSFPERWDTVQVKTWPSTGKDIRAFRRYEMRNQGGELVAEALGQWMTLDLKNRRPRRIPEKLAGFPLLNLDGRELNSDRNQITPLDKDGGEIITTVGKYDLDMNSHVNSVKYIEWSTGYQITHPDLQCKEVIIQHQAEAYYGDKIYRAAKKTGNEQKITLFNEEGVAISTAIATFNNPMG